MHVFINKNILGGFFYLKENNISNLGSTWEDYENNLFVELNEEQKQFLEDNPGVTPKEVWNMEIEEVIIPGKTIEQYRNELSFNIMNYDYQTNEFFINDISTWLTPSERSNYKQSIESAKLLGEERLQFFVNDTLIDVSVEQAEQMLAMVQLYADKCFIVTKTHQNNIKNLTSVEDIENYNYKTGYPEKLSFII